MGRREGLSWTVPQSALSQTTYHLSLPKYEYLVVCLSVQPVCLLVFYHLLQVPFALFFFFGFLRVQLLCGPLLAVRARSWEKEE